MNTQQTKNLEIINQAINALKLENNQTEEFELIKKGRKYNYVSARETLAKKVILENNNGHRISLFFSHFNEYSPSSVAEYKITCYENKGSICGGILSINSFLNKYPNVELTSFSSIFYKAEKMEYKIPSYIPLPTSFNIIEKSAVAYGILRK